MIGQSTGTTPSLWLSVGLPIAIAVAGAVTASFVAWVSSRTTKEVAEMSLRTTKEQWTRDRRAEAYLSLVTLTFNLRQEADGVAEPGAAAEALGGREDWTHLHSRIRLYGSAAMRETMEALMTARALFYSGVRRQGVLRSPDDMDQRTSTLRRLCDEAEEIARRELN